MAFILRRRARRRVVILHLRSFRPQRLDWINRRRAARRQMAGQHGSRREQGGHRGERDWIERADAEEQRSHQPCDAHCAAEADRHSDAHHHQTAPYEQPADLVRLRAESQPDARFRAAAATPRTR